MPFEVKDKVGLITGGASGLGYQYAVELLEKGARGVTLADVNAEIGNTALQQIEDKFGKNKAIFVRTDVSSYEQFEDAFKKTIEKFKNIDILINNAGILDDSEWKKEVAVNVNGTIHGLILGMDKYLSKFKSGPEAVIVNVSSIAVTQIGFSFPIYTSTKFAIHGMTLVWGHPGHYKRTKVRVVGINPGATKTPMIIDMSKRNLGPEYEEIRLTELGDVLYQTKEQLAPCVIEVIEKAPNGTTWVIEGGGPPYQYIMADRHKIPKQYLQ